MEMSEGNSKKTSDYIEKAFRAPSDKEIVSDTSISHPKIHKKTTKKGKTKEIPLTGKMREPKEKKLRNLKLGAQAREGVESDKGFLHISFIVPRTRLLGNHTWDNSFV
jgi:hypothetical protein